MYRGIKRGFIWPPCGDYGKIQWEIAQTQLGLMGGNEVLLLPFMPMAWQAGFFARSALRYRESRRLRSCREFPLSAR